MDSKQMQRHFYGVHVFITYITLKKVLPFQNKYSYRDFSTCSKRDLINLGKYVTKKASRQRLRQHNGKTQKFCRGPGSNGGHWVDTDSFYLDKRTTAWRPWCKECDRVSGGHKTNMSFARSKFAFIELVNRLGQAEAARRIGISDGHLRNILSGRYSSVRHKTAVNAIMALHEVRKNGEVRHRDSIRHGAKARGRTEKEVRARLDLYKPHGDINTETKKRSSRVDKTIERVIPM